MGERLFIRGLRGGDRLFTSARIRYLDDNKVDCIPIEKIKEFRINKPRNLLDFDKKKVYRAEYEDAKNPEQLLLRVQIADLACKYKCVFLIYINDL